MKGGETWRNYKRKLTYSKKKEKQKKKKKFESTIYLSSSDSYTLSNGPTLYLTDDIEKIGIFLLQTANIPNNILEKIDKI
mgnify:CR=1 FL=1